MHAINYEAPTTLKDAVALLAQHGEKARPLCGGTDLLIQLRAGVRRPDHVVDVKKIPELSQISFDLQKGLRLGAAHQGVPQPARRHRPDRPLQFGYQSGATKSAIASGLKAKEFRPTTWLRSAFGMCSSARIFS